MAEERELTRRLEVLVGRECVGIIEVEDGLYWPSHRGARLPACTSRAAAEASVLRRHCDEAVARAEKAEADARELGKLRLDFRRGAVSRLSPGLFALEGVEPAKHGTSASFWAKHKHTGIVTQFVRGKAMRDYRAVLEAKAAILRVDGA